MPCDGVHPSDGGGLGRSSSPWTRWLWVGVILAGFLAQCLMAAATKSAVADELAAHLPSGILYWKTGRFAGGLDNPPLGQLLATVGPILTGSAAYPLRQDPAALLPARIPEILFGLGIVVMVGVMARRWAGAAAGAAALLAAACCPDLIAHSSVATLDVSSTFFFFLACSLAAKAADQPSAKRIAAVGVVLATGLLFKFTVVYACVALPVALLAADLPARRRIRLAVGLVLVTGFALAVLSRLAYLGRPSLDPWQTIRMRLGDTSAAWKSVAAFLVHALSWVFPSGLMEGMLGKLAHGSVDQRAAYLLGEWRDSTFDWYYPVALLVKIPIPILMLGTLGCVLMVRGPLRRQLLFGLVPPLVLLVGMIFLHPVNIGVRHVLPLYPVGLVLAGVGAARLLRGGIAGRALTFGLGAWLVASAVRATPDQLAYFNELAGGSEGGDAVLLDSNLDWGQDELALAHFASTNSAVVNPKRPCAGLVAANVGSLHGLGHDWSARLRWLLRLPHHQSIGRSIRIYQVDEAQMRAAVGVDPLGPIDLALWLTETGKPKATLDLLAGPRPSGAVGLAWTHAKIEALLATGQIEDAAALIPAAADPALMGLVEHRRLDGRGVPWNEQPVEIRRATFKALIDREAWSDVEALARQLLAEQPPAGQPTPHPAPDPDAWLALVRARLRQLQPSEDPLRAPPAIVFGLPPMPDRVFELLSRRPSDLSLEDRLDRCTLLVKLDARSIALSELGASLFEFPHEQRLAWAFGVLVYARKGDLGSFAWPDVKWPPQRVQ